MVKSEVPGTSLFLFPEGFLIEKIVDLSVKILDRFPGSVNFCVVQKMDETARKGVYCHYTAGRGKCRFAGTLGTAAVLGIDGMGERGYNGCIQKLGGYYEKEVT